MNANPQGLFPKITNLRLESQSGAPGSNTQNQLITMNVLKHSGGHISGMSSSHHHNIIHQQNERNFRGMASVSAGLSNNGQPNAAVVINGGAKPLSSPRLQEHGVETNMAYQQ
jgi:hypothetical protein